MIMRGFRGLSVTPSDAIIQDIQAQALGGVVLFDFDVPAGKPVRNITSPEQVRGLINSLQDAADIPLLVAVDYEGGRVNRLKAEFGFPEIQSPQTLGGGDTAQTGEQAETMAETLSDLGFNLNLAPVVDVNVNPNSPAIGALERSYSDDPEKVTRHAAAFIRAHRDRNILCTLKHFPGHGSAAADSHMGLTDITDTWSEKELIPYRRLIGMGLADLIMTAHVFHTGLDPEAPATLSGEVIGGVLRRQLGFNGAVLSDCMQMGAVVEEYGFEDAIYRAVRAGVDILVYANNSVYEEDVAVRAIEALSLLVKSGKIIEERIDASWERIMCVKSGLI
jgi:beta-N-acetylhexosaminidase